MVDRVSAPRTTPPSKHTPVMVVPVFMAALNARPLLDIIVFLATLSKLNPPLSSRSGMYAALTLPDWSSAISVHSDTRVS